MTECRSFNFKAIAILTVSVMVFASFATVFADSSDADSSITVTDGKDIEHTFDYVPEHIATIGLGITVTAVRLGVLDKIVVADKYSNDDKYDILKEFTKKVSDGKIAAGGSIYSSGSADLKKDLINAADTEKGGIFDKNKDVIFITGSDTYIVEIVDDLKKLGFKNILQWNLITEYSDIIDLVKTISLVTLGTEDKIVSQMSDLSGYIKDKLGDREKAEAFYVSTDNNGNFKVGNTGSLANSMIIAAGGNSITVDSSKSASTYETNLTLLVESHPDVIIFVDNRIASDESSMNSLRSKVGSDVTMVNLEALWNNYSTESMNGVWTMACALYPDLFSGDVPYADEESQDNTALYVGAGIVVVVIIIAAGVLFLRKH